MSLVENPENPFSPGAGGPPPERAGRDELRERVRVAITRIRSGKSAQSLVLTGLRGVGKTVLLDRMREEAQAAGVCTVRLEVAKERSLPGLLAPELRIALLRLSKTEPAKEMAVRGLRALAGFTQGLKRHHADIEVSLDHEVEPGLADNGNLDHDLQALLVESGAAAQAAGTALVIFADELQCLPELQLGALIMAIHRCAQSRVPVLLVGAGLPQLRGHLGNAKSYAERLFEFSEMGCWRRPETEPPCRSNIEPGQIAVRVTVSCG